MKIGGKAEPRFDRDYTYGRQGELQIGDFLEWIASGNGQVEVKRKRYLDLYFYVETHCDKGRTGNWQPSGILVTTAKAWAFVLHDSGIAILFPTEVLLAMLNDPTTEDKQELDGSCPTRGRLVHFHSSLYRLRRHLQQRQQPQQAPRPRATQPIDTDYRWD